MVTVDDMGGESVELTGIAIMTAGYSDAIGSYFELSMKFGYTGLNELTETFDNNWLSAPTVVFSDPQLVLTGIVGGEWLLFEFDESFSYDASANLLFEIAWNGPEAAQGGSIYAMSWPDDKDATLTISDFDAATGNLETSVPHMLFVTSMSLEPNTFAGIKSSF